MSRFEDRWQRYSLGRDNENEFALLEVEWADCAEISAAVHILSVEAAQWLHIELGRMLPGGDNE